jgi:subtilisin family serine protease
MVGMRGWSRTYVAPVTVLVALLVAGCGGGGGAGSAIPLPTIPPIVPGCSGAPGVAGTIPSVQASGAINPSATPVPPSQVAVQSDPQGLSVQLDGVPDGLTNETLTPQYSQYLHTISIGGGTMPYTVCFSQNGQNGVTVYYDPAMDTQASIGNIQSVLRALGAQSSGISGAGIPVVAGHRSPSAAPAGASGTDGVAGEVEVLYDPHTVPYGSDRMAHMEAAAGARSGRTISPPGAPQIARILYVPPGRERAVEEALRNEPGVVAVARPQYRYLESMVPQTAPAVPVNDPEYNIAPQWDMSVIQAPNAWGYLAAQTPPDYGSRSVTIAVIDTGIDTNPQNTFVASDLIPKVTYAESDISGVTTPCATITGCTAVQDDDGHGTNVAGIAANITNDAVGFAGVAGGASLQIYKIFGPSGSASTSDEAQAIYDAIRHGAKVINLSLGSAPAAGSGPDPVEEAAIEYALQQGVFVAAAAGNERSQGVQGLDYPAAYPGVMAVGASALNDSASPGKLAGATEYVASYSNSGPGLGVVAPGGDPSGSSDNDPLHWITNDYSTTASQYPCNGQKGNPPATACAVLIAGTSQATPHVAGAAALLLSVNPLLTPGQLVRIIDATADDIRDPNQGHGRLDLYRAMAVVEGDPNPPSYTPGVPQFIAFAYTNSGAVNAAPAIADRTFAFGVPVNANGTFRIADVPPNVGSYKIGVWYDANGDGKIDAGDWFGASGPCSTSAPCASASGITVTQITSATFSLP